MPLSRPDPAPAARRLLELAGGWLPPADGEPPAPAPVPPPADVALGRGRLRLDPGRRGALALAAVALLAALVAVALLVRSRPQPVVVPPTLDVGRVASPSVAAEVVVSVAGTVRRPGLVRLPAGSRVDDALRAAGGLLPGTSPGVLNLARKLADGEQVLVGIAPLPGSTAGTAGGSGTVDLNSATLEQLDGLPGIGPVLAQHILDWRTEHGRFASVDQLREVPGIGESKFAEVRTKVSV